MTATWKILLIPLTAAALLAPTGCNKDAVENLINDEAAPLAEEDLPNCSRVVNCCDYLAANDLTPDTINQECTETYKPSANTVITNYKDARSAIDDNPDFTTDEGRTEAKTALKDQTQGTFETGCRCFLDETVGQVGTFALPLDCEFFADVGDQNLSCDDATTTLVDVATN